MAHLEHRQIWSDGLWRNNAGLVQLLGLCPLLAVSNSFVNSLGLGLATILTLVVSNVTVSLCRNLLRPEIRIPVYVLIIAAVVTAIELLMQAFFYDLYQTLGIFIPLIVTNCVIIGRAEAFASRQPPLMALSDGLAIGSGFTLVLLALGSLREIIGQGTLFANAHLLLGDWAKAIQLELLPGYSGFLLALLPPGAFIGLGLLVAGKNWFDQRAAARPQPHSNRQALYE